MAESSPRPKVPGGHGEPRQKGGRRGVAGLAWQPSHTRAEGCFHDPPSIAIGVSALYVLLASTSRVHRGFYSLRGRTDQPTRDDVARTSDRRKIRGKLSGKCASTTPSPQQHRHPLPNRRTPMKGSTTDCALSKSLVPRHTWCYVVLLCCQPRLPPLSLFALRPLSTPSLLHAHAPKL